MKIALGEIWNFADLIKESEEGWSYKLLAGPVEVIDISQDVLQSLRTDEHYDTELLPSVFTFREILWQPDVFTDSAQSLPGLRILKAHCEEISNEYQESKISTHMIYARLLQGIASSCDIAISSIDGEEEDVKRSLGELRTAVFPIIKFFIFHPMNRLDYYRDAVNRLNYAVKVMLTQFNGRYTELIDPYWHVTYTHKKGVQKVSPIQDEKEKS